MYDKMYLFEAETNNDQVQYVEKNIDRTGDAYDILLSVLNTLAYLVDETGDHAPFSLNDETVSVIDMDNNDTSSVHTRQTSVPTSILQLEKQKLKDTISSMSNHQGMTELLTQVYGDQSQMCKILRFVDQSFVVSMLGHFGETLISRGLRCKDVRGTWKILINKNENTYSVIHRRREQVIKPIGNTRLADLFQFEWQVEIFLDSHRMQHLDAIHVKLLEIDWSSAKVEVSDEEKEQYEKEFKSAFGAEEQISRTNLQVHKSEQTMKRQSEKARISIGETHPKDANKGCFSSLMSSDDVDDLFNVLSKHSK
jgi:hypothetical protein